MSDPGLSGISSDSNIVGNEPGHHHYQEFLERAEVAHLAAVVIFEGYDTTNGEHVVAQIQANTDKIQTMNTELTEKTSILREAIKLVKDIWSEMRSFFQALAYIGICLAVVVGVVWMIK